ncbi:MAG TPA: BamA/TamA family outer membrane protein [Longimicrobiales bacterium]
MRAKHARGPARTAVPPLIILLVGAAACGVRTAAREELSALAPYEGEEIEEVVFVNPGPFSADTLIQLTETQPSRCSLLGLPICVPFTGIGEEVHRLDLDVLRRDVVRLVAFYRQSGYYGTTVVPVAERERGDRGEDVVVKFLVEPGDPVVLEEFRVEGLEGVVDVAELLPRLPLQPGELFDLGDYAASADTIEGILLSLGHAHAEVLRSYDVDTVADVATAALIAVPGPEVVVDSIIVRGAEELGRKTVLRQLTFRPGDLLRSERLVESQRNLYALEIVEFAAVTVAPDTLQATPGDSARSTVLVQVAEGPVHVVEAAVGFGTVECFRGRVEWVSRSFGGGARRLALRGVVSKIGIGEPLDAGFGGSICRAFEGDPFGDDLDYRLSADLTQPYFLTPRNSITLSVYAERLSEPDVFQREAQGARVAVTHALDPRQTLTAALDAERGRTRATAAVFCVAFLVCRPEDVDALAQTRVTNTVGLNWFRNRTDFIVNPTRGHVMRSSFVWAAPWLGSEVDYGRTTFDGSLYARVGSGSVLAANLRTGTFLGSASLSDADDFIPPEDRFYAGGANSVRGFARNTLGPGVYVEEGPQFEEENVEFVPIGGLSVVVTSLEVRFPSPFLRNRLRFAAFIDAGAVDEDRLWSMDGDDWRITPGVGVRIATPVGPVRMDVAYNPYAPPTAPLYLIEPETRVLVRAADAFTPARDTFLSRLRVHLAVGQPF